MIEKKNTKEKKTATVNVLKPMCEQMIRKVQHWYVLQLTDLFAFK